MVEINNTTKQKINLTQTRQVVEYFLATHRKTNWEVSVAIVGAVRMRRLNKKYRQIDKTTDVLSFRGGEAMNKFLGEIVINMAETAKVSAYQEVFELMGQARSIPSARSDRGVGTAQSKTTIHRYLFYFLLVHGLLHLIGYNDEVDKDRRRMIVLGHKFLEDFFKKSAII
jgi:probable rRNA maturation factor